MRNKIYLLIFVVAMAAIIALQHRRVQAITAEKERHQQNSEALLQDVERYRTKDSLNVAKVRVLSLEIEQLEQYRAEDAKLIKSLKIKKSELEQITKAQMRTIADIQGDVRDTIIYRDVIVGDTVQTLNVSTEWIDLHGIVANGTFDGTLEVRDSLVVVESVERKRFLGFLWKTKKIKHREVDVMTKNPYTEIVGVESIIIEK